MTNDTIQLKKVSNGYVVRQEYYGTVSEFVYPTLKAALGHIRRWAGEEAEAE